MICMKIGSSKGRNKESIEEERAYNVTFLEDENCYCILEDGVGR